jgi:hypothetical protein
VGITYRCNKCTREFGLKESRYKHTFEFALNPQIRLEVEAQVDDAEELEQWEQQSQDMEERLENTKAIQEEIRDQLRTLVTSQLKKRG